MLKQQQVQKYALKVVAGIMKTKSLAHIQTTLSRFVDPFKVTECITLDSQLCTENTQGKHANSVELSLTV